jgi:hypothetical protein
VAAEFDGNDSQSSMHKAAGIEVAITELQRERTLIIAAQQQTEAAIEQDAQLRQQEERRIRAATAREIADGISALNHELDAALLALRQLFERRMALLRQLQSTGMGDLVATKLMSKGVATRAACHSGLHQFISLEKCAPGSFLSLASADPILSAIGKVKLTNGGSPDEASHD